MNRVISGKTKPAASVGFAANGRNILGMERLQFQKSQTVIDHK